MKIFLEQFEKEDLCIKKDQADFKENAHVCEEMYQELVEKYTELRRFTRIFDNQLEAREVNMK